MNKRIFSAIVLALSACLGSLLALDGAPAATQSAAAFDEQQFYSQLQGEIKKTSDRLAELEKKVTAENKNFDGELKDEFNAKVNTLGAKQVLYKNFENTPSITSAVVRASLLKTFQKEVINDKDLEELQQVVNEEKAKGLPAK